ncbi:MAG: GNAT family acetyltransferase [Burkholderiales bacterium]|nr:GNAT family acetyltransferase [Burkholderiales bacterium]
MKIRTVTPDDIDAIIDLWTRVFPEYSDPLKPQRDPRGSIERKLAFGDGLFWLGLQGNDLAGTVMAGYDGHRGWIYSLGVDPAHRRSGLGQTLVAHAEAQLGALGCPKINLQVLDDNSGALTFWQSVGYAPDAVLSLGKRL